MRLSGHVQSWPATGRAAREPHAQIHQHNTQPPATSAYPCMPMLREASDHAALLGLRGQLLEMEDVRLVLLIRVIHRNTPDSVLRNSPDTGGQSGWPAN